MAPPHKYDWSTAEQEFMQAPDSYPYTRLKDISDRCNIPYQTVRRYAGKNKWNSRRVVMYYQARKLKYPQPIRATAFSTRGMPKYIADMLQKLSNVKVSHT